MTQDSWVTKVVASGGWKVAGILLVVVIVPLLVAGYSGIRADIHKGNEDIMADISALTAEFKELKGQVTQIDKKVDNRDTIDSLLVHGYRDHEARLRALERR